MPYNTLPSVYDAVSLLEDIRTMYQQGKQIQAKLARYTAGTDAPFNSAINTIFTAGERAELNTMLGNVNTLVTAWEANHQGVLGL